MPSQKQNVHTPKIFSKFNNLKAIYSFEDSFFNKIIQLKKYLYKFLVVFLVKTDFCLSGPV